MLQTLFTPFFLGMLSTTSPCVLPLYPGFLAYLSGMQNSDKTNKTRYFLGLFILLGVLSMMVFLGAIIAAISVSIARVLAYIIPFADLVIIILGVLLLVDINPFKSLPQIRSPIFKNPILNAYLYGILYGPLTLPCSAPLVVAIFAYSFTAEEAINKLIVFLGFGLGFGLPLLFLSFLTGALQHKLVRFFAQHSRTINLISGILLLGIGLVDIYSNWAMLIAFWGLPQ